MSSKNKMKKKLNIFYISYDGITDPLGQSQILPYLLGISKNKIYKITIVSFEKANNYLLNKDLILKKISSNNINWIPLKYTKHPPILSTIWDIYKLNRIIKNLNYLGVDLIHSRSYITSIVALAFKKKQNVPFIFDMRGFYADERVDGKIWNLNNFIHKKIYKYFKNKEKEFLQFSDYTISLTETGKKEILNWKLPNQSPIKVIPCCTDKKLFNLKNIKNIRADIGFDKDDFIISYVGSIGTWYMLDEMLDFFKCLQIKKPNAKFFFISRDEPQLILDKVKNKKIDSRLIKIYPSSREMMPSYIALSDISIFFILPVYSKKASSPTKMGEIMSLGIPIICNSGVGDVDRIMKDSMENFLINDFSYQEYVRVINLVLDDFEFDKQKVISTAHNYFSLEIGIKKYMEVYNKALN